MVTKSTQSLQLTHTNAPKNDLPTLFHWLLIFAGFWLVGCRPFEFTMSQFSDDPTKGYVITGTVAVRMDDKQASASFVVNKDGKLLCQVTDQSIALDEETYQAMVNDPHDSECVASQQLTLTCGGHWIHLGFELNQWLSARHYFAAQYKACSASFSVGHRELFEKIDIEAIITSPAGEVVELTTATIKQKRLD